MHRPELAGYQDAHRLLVLGTGGSGKSRSLAELVTTYSQEVDHVIVPRKPLQAPQDLIPLHQESFSGNVLLVWDDIHTICPERGNTVFRKAVDELTDRLSPDHTLHVLATSRTDQIDTLPGNVYQTDSSLWSTFEIVELEPLSVGAVTTLFDRALIKENMVATEKVRKTFYRKAIQTDPSPLYVTSVVETTQGRRLTMDDIEALPSNALAIWENQYATIKTANDEQRFVLWAIKLLAEFRVPYYDSLIQGIYAHVLNRDELSFEPPVTELTTHQWFVPTNETDTSATEYVVHDVKVEAIDESIEQLLPSLSVFFLENLHQYLPAGEANIERILHGNLGNLLRERQPKRHSDLAAKHYERILTDIEPEDARTHLNYATLLTENGQFEAAQEHYEQAIDINPDLAEVHNNYANHLSENGQVEKAEHHFDRALTINPKYARAHFNYANHLRKCGRFEAAKVHYEQTIDINPDLAEAHTNYAPLLAADGQVKKAQIHYERALDIDSEDPNAHNNYAILLEENNQIKEAKTHYEQALDLDPTHADAHTNYAFLLFNEGLIDEAKEHYIQGLDLDPEDARAHYDYATLLTTEGRTDEAEEHYELALDLNPNLAEAHGNYAFLLFTERRIEEAETHYKQALDIDSEYVRAHNNYATLLFREGRLKEAEIHLKRVIEIDPDHADAHGNYATLLAQDGRIEEAKKHAKRAHEIRGI